MKWYVVSNSRTSVMAKCPGSFDILELAYIRVSFSSFEFLQIPSFQYCLCLLKQLVFSLQYFCFFLAFVLFGGLCHLLAATVLTCFSL